MKKTLLEQKILTTILWEGDQLSRPLLVAAVVFLSEAVHSGRSGYYTWRVHMQRPKSRHFSQSEAGQERSWHCEASMVSRCLTSQRFSP